METQLAFVKLEVCGIQNFLCSTGKLKEMLGGSEIIDSLPEAFLDKRLEELSLREVQRPEQGRDWYIAIQRGAGVICLIMPDREKAAEFLTHFSEEALERFPGLPLYGTQVPMSWTSESYRQARREAENDIEAQRARSPVACGTQMLSVLRAARLDGYPACGEDGDELVSVPSATRRTEKCLEDSRRRLRELTTAPEGVKILWEDDLGKMLGEERARVALVHIDGNDLGKLFRKKLDESRNLPLERSIAAIKELSGTVSRANRAAFQAAVKDIMDFELSRGATTRLVMPLRPLVMGGDDITLVIRADLALLFLTRFAAEFEKESERCGERLSAGAGMVVMKPSYPFARAFSLVESLTESAKGVTVDASPRPGSLDYLVLTEDVEDDVDACRNRVCTADDGSLLTTKPFILGRGNGGSFATFVRNGAAVLGYLPRSAVRAAMNACHSGESSSDGHWKHICWNLERRLGGRYGSRLMQPAMFRALFPDGFFATDPGSGKKRTMLGDFLELEHLLPASAEERSDMLDRLADVEKDG